MSPQLIYGTATFGMDVTGFADAEAAKSMLKTVRSLGIKRLDTAPRYPPLSTGRAEELIGESVDISGDLTVDTKVYTDTRTDGSGDLARDAMQKSVCGSLERLKRSQGVNILYAHRADPATPLEEQVRNFNEQIAQGHCEAWGVSNTPPAVLEKIVQICEENGWQKPSAYQGDYNLVTRAMEAKLLPILRAHGMSFVAFRALGAGFLTGKFVNNQHEGTRLSDDNPLGKAMQRVFSDEELRRAVKEFDTEVKKHGLSSLEVAVRWVAHHSALRDADAIILGASKETQLQETVSLIQKGPLDPPVLALVDELWASVQQSRENVL
ncbi:putative oxidoreductase [Podospora didyma]|uniref:Oxidoreductase n=1 Tax=Podospora didyma TaxID=330526 RepID=A0AAE0K6V3_9PEZI|nr:putative oxidoreductase [Podospora didyma]